MVKHAMLAEKCDYEMVWSAEDYFTGRDAITPLACFALSTERVKLGTGIINPHTRSPGLIAATMSTLDELSNGRMVLGLGAGTDWTPMYPLEDVMHVKTMRDTIQLVRSLFSNKTVTHRGRTLTIQSDPFWWPEGVIRPVRSRIPIYIGARGPKMEKLTAEVGDGLILDVEIPIPFARKRINDFKIRLEEVGRDFNDVDVACLIPVSVSEDGELDEATRRYTAWTIAGISSKKEEDERRMIAAYSGVDEEEISRVKEAFKKGGLKEACKYVSEESVNLYVAWGSMEKCANKIKEYVTAGVKLPTIVPIGDAEAAIRTGQKFAAETS